MSFDNNLVSSIETELKYSKIRIQDQDQSFFLKGVVGDEVVYPNLNKIIDISTNTITELLILSEDVNKKRAFEEYDKTIYINRDTLIYLKNINWTESNNSFDLTSSKKINIYLYTYDDVLIPTSITVTKINNYNGNNILVNSYLNYSIEINLPDNLKFDNYILPCYLKIYYNEKKDDLLIVDLNINVNHSESPGGV